MQVQIQHRHLTFNSGSTLGQKTYLLVKNPTDHQLTQVLQSYMQPAENTEASKRNQERVAENETGQKPLEPGCVVNDTNDGMHYLEKHVPQELLRR